MPCAAELVRYEEVRRVHGPLSHDLGVQRRRSLLFGLQGVLFGYEGIQSTLKRLDALLTVAGDLLLFERGNRVLRNFP